MPISDFTFKKLLRHYAKQVFTHFKQSWHTDPDAKMVGLVSIGAFSLDCEIFVNRFKLYSVSLVSRNFSQISPLRVHRICRHVPAGRAAPCPAYDTMFGISQAGRQPGAAEEYSRYHWNTLATKSLIYLSSSQSGIRITIALSSLAHETLIVQNSHCQTNHYTCT